MRTHFALAGLLAALAAAQNAPVPVKDSIIRVNTRLVEVDVVASDRNGPIAGLKQSDFMVLDNGKPQRISEFTVKTARSRPQVKPLPPGAIANRANTLGEEPVEATVLLWDVINTDLADQAWVRQQVLTYLKSMQPGERIALYRLSKSLKIIQDFTGDPERLRIALGSVSPEQSVNLSAGNLGNMAGTITVPAEPAADDNSPEAEQTRAQIAMIQDLNQMQETAAMEMQWYALRDRALITFGALQQIADHLSGVRGRKKLIWVSGAFPAVATQLTARHIGTDSETSVMETFNVNFQLQKAVRQLNEAHVAVYPIDARGLTYENRAEGFGSNNLSGKTADGQKMSGTLSGGLLNPGYDTMIFLAEGTGGRATYADNDIQGAMRRVFEDFEVSYTLGFYPSDQRLDGSYHSLEVKVNRRGANLRHRKGYFASDVKVATERDRENAINRAMQSELDATQIGLMGTLHPVEGQPGLYLVDVVIDAHDIEFKPQGDRFLASIGYATYFSKTPRLVGTSETIAINLPAERMRDALINGLTLSRGVYAGDDEGRLRIAIEDRATGKVGSIWIPLERSTRAATTESWKTDSSPRSAAPP
jgi:VWFA-related protein